MKEPKSDSLSKQIQEMYRKHVAQPSIDKTIENQKVKLVT